MPHPFDSMWIHLPEKMLGFPNGCRSALATVWCVVPLARAVIGSWDGGEVVKWGWGEIK